MREYLITKQSLQVFGYLIPDEYKKQIQEGELTGIGVLDDWHDNEVMGIMLMRTHNDWMEIVWLCLDEYYRGCGYADELLEHCVDIVRRRGKVWGAFADIPQGETEEQMKLLFSVVGFVLQPITHSSYATTLKKLQETAFFRGAAKEESAKGVVFLEDAEEHLLRKLLQRIQEDENIVPLSLPVDWGHYNGKLSGIHCGADRVPDAMLLIAENGDHLTLECAWAQEPTALIVLLREAVKAAGKNCPEEQKIYVPTVTDASTKLAEKILPDAEPVEGLRARLMF